MRRDCPPGARAGAAKELPLTEWPFYCAHRRNTDRTWKRHSGVPMCQSILRAVRSAQIRRVVHFMPCSAVPPKISRRGGLLNIFR